MTEQLLRRRSAGFRALVGLDDGGGTERPANRNAVN